MPVEGCSLAALRQAYQLQQVSGLLQTRDYACAVADESVSPLASYRQRHDMRTQPKGRPAVPGSDTVVQPLDVPGARLYYERQGAGPLLLMIGSTRRWPSSWPMPA